MVVIDKIGHGDRLFRLAISSFIDGYTKAVASLPCVFYIWILLLDVANHGFAADPFSDSSLSHQRTPSNRVHSFDDRVVDILADSARALSLLRWLLHRRSGYGREAVERETSACEPAGYPRSVKSLKSLIGID